MADMKTSSTEFSKLPPGVGGGRGGAQERAGLRGDGPELVYVHYFKTLVFLLSMIHYIFSFYSYSTFIF